MNYDDLGKRIRALRRQAGLTQEQLARATGMSPSFIGHIERGTRKVSLDTLTEVAKALGVTGASLMGEGSQRASAVDTSRAAYALGDAPEPDIALMESDSDVNFRPMISGDTRGYMLRELIALLEEKD